MINTWFKAEDKFEQCKDCFNKYSQITCNVCELQNGRPKFFISSIETERRGRRILIHPVKDI